MLSAHRTNHKILSKWYHPRQTSHCGAVHPCIVFVLYGVSSPHGGDIIEDELGLWRCWTLLIPRNPPEYIDKKQLDPRIFHASSRSPYHNAMYSLTSPYLIPCPASPGQPVQLRARCQRRRCQQQRPSRTEVGSSSRSPVTRSKHKQAHIQVSDTYQDYIRLLTKPAWRPII